MLINSFHTKWHPTKPRQTEGEREMDQQEIFFSSPEPGVRRKNRIQRMTNLARGKSLVQCNSSRDNNNQSSDTNWQQWLRTEEENITNAPPTKATWKVQWPHINLVEAINHARTATINDHSKGCSAGGWIGAHKHNPWSVCRVEFAIPPLFHFIADSRRISWLSFCH